MAVYVFSWDQAKGRSNQRKHGVSFETAKLVFEDAHHLSRQDRVVHGEQRWQTLGRVGDEVLLVAHACHDTDQDGEYIRIISARRATKLERKIYEEGAEIGPQGAGPTGRKAGT
ncbi:MAG TPA: BrnT family toxin [Steroidobacteraceae bacterium]